jgi:hypothetical protein
VSAARFFPETVNQVLIKCGAGDLPYNFAGTFLDIFSHNPIPKTGIAERAWNPCIVSNRF